jgi:hypothetical protein
LRSTVGRDADVPSRRTASDISENYSWLAITVT